MSIPPDAFDPYHIPPMPRRTGTRTGTGTPPPRRGSKPPPRLRITVIGLGPLQEACLAGMLALALSWFSAELAFRLADATEAAPKAIVSAAMQP
jgi:hypothetical protein